MPAKDGSREGDEFPLFIQEVSFFSSPLLLRLEPHVLARFGEKSLKNSEIFPGVVRKKWCSSIRREAPQMFRYMRERPPAAADRRFDTIL
jgi:hypothetical protein